VNFIINGYLLRTSWSDCDCKVAFLPLFVSFTALGNPGRMVDFSALPLSHSLIQQTLPAHAQLYHPKANGHTSTILAYMSPLANMSYQAWYLMGAGEAELLCYGVATLAWMLLQAKI